jgi:hypothetical protein
MQLMLPKVLALWIGFVLMARAQEATERADRYFPLVKGNCWIYSGEVKWSEPDGGETTVNGQKMRTNATRTKTLTWKMEVVDTLQKGIVFAAYLKGFPDDLSWYEPGKERGDCCIVRVGTGQYHKFGGEGAKKVWEKLQSDGDVRLEMLDENTLFLDVPLIAGKVYGEFANTPRARYCWVVEGEAEFDPAKIKGAPKTTAGTLFTLTYRTSPDHQFVDFVPGLGITGYVYGHHGTVSECNMDLVQFIPASGKASQEKKTQ